MKNTKTIFLISFFGCFVLPAIIILFATLSMFFDAGFIIGFSNWVLFGGGVWIVIIYQIIIILITLMLGLTLKLKNFESITTEDVVKGKKNDTVIRRIETIEVKDEFNRVRKEIKVPDKRDISDIDLSYEEVKSRVSRDKSTQSKTPVNSTSTNTTNKTDRPKRQIVSNLKK